MHQNIQYTKFETYGYWKQNDGTEELKVVVSFGKASLLLRDVNDSILSQWSFPSIIAVTLSNGETFFSPDEDGYEKLRIEDREMINQLKKVIKKRTVKNTNYKSFFIVFVAIFLVSILGWNAKSIMVSVATSITPAEKTKILFEDLIKFEVKQFGRKCLNPRGQGVLNRLVSEFTFINNLNILRVNQQKAFIFPNGQIFLTEDFISQIHDPLELINLLSFANHSNASKAPLKLFFSQHSWVLLAKYIAGLNVIWRPDALQFLNIENIKKMHQYNGSKLKTSISGLEWVRIQNICI